jgi:hypothetical protein
LALLAPLALAWRCATDPALPFLTPADAWITPADAVSGQLRQWGSEHVPQARFTRSFAWRRGTAVGLRLRALRDFEVAVNGAPVANGDGTEWRSETRVDLSHVLRPGVNELAVTVSNPHGPPLLSVEVSGLAEPLRGDASWAVTLDGLPGRVARADDTRIDPNSLAAETALEGLAQRWDPTLGLFVAGALGFLACRRMGASMSRHAPLAVVAVAGLAWLALFVSKISRIPLEIGFDARHHLAYVTLLRETGRVPLATDGWSTFHPPLFYFVSLWAGESQLLLRLLPWLAGLGAVAVTWLLARRLLPDDPRGAALAVLFAAVLPMNVYSSAYFSNESLHTLLAGGVVLSAVGLLLAPRSSAARVALLGALLARRSAGWRRSGWRWLRRCSPSRGGSICETGPCTATP